MRTALSIFSPTLLALIAIYFGVVLALSLLGRATMQSRTLHLLRAFFPSWRFFEDYGWTPILFYRTQDAGGAPGEWTTVSSPLRRRLSLLWINADGNHELALGSLLLHLISDLEHADEKSPVSIEASVSFRQVRNWVRQTVLRKGSSAANQYQFKLCTHYPDDPSQGVDDILISRSFEVRDAAL